MFLKCLIELLVLNEQKKYKQIFVEAVEMICDISVNFWGVVGNLKIDCLQKNIYYGFTLTAQTFYADSMDCLHWHLGLIESKDSVCYVNAMWTDSTSCVLWHYRLCTLIAWTDNNVYVYWQKRLGTLTASRLLTLDFLTQDKIFNIFDNLKWIIKFDFYILRRKSKKIIT